MNQTSLAATGLVVAAVAVVILTAVTLTVSASSHGGPLAGASTSILGPTGIQAAVSSSPTVQPQFGLFAGTLLVVIGGVGGLWMGISRGIGYLGHSGRIDVSGLALSQASVNDAVSPGSILGDGVNQEPHNEEDKPSEDGASERCSIRPGQPEEDRVSSRADELGVWKSVREEAKSPRKNTRRKDVSGEHHEKTRSTRRESPSELADVKGVAAKKISKPKRNGKVKHDSHSEHEHRSGRNHQRNLDAQNPL